MVGETGGTGASRQRARIAVVAAALVVLAGCGTTTTGSPTTTPSANTTTAGAGPDASATPHGADASTTPPERATASADAVPSPERTGTGGEDPSATLDRAVVVELAVDWRPEGELDDEEVAQQRARIQAAEDQLLEDLGSHAHVRRRLHATAQVSLAVDDTGLRRLRDHPLVAMVQEDTPDPAN